jgi:arylsulfatase A-like enzyme
MPGAGRRSSGGRLLVTGALLAVLCACGESRVPRVNLLLISLDSVRADFVGAYGAELPHAPDGSSPTPTLDRLAREGVLYENARSTTSWTLPAHASLFTGVPELVHGVEQDGQRLPERLSTLAETLRAKGWSTAGVYSGPYLDPRYGFGRGFERYAAAYGPELARAADEVEVATRLLAAAEADRDAERVRVATGRLQAAEGALETASHRDVSSEQVTERVLAELARARADERPFFVFAHYFDPHYDYAPPEPFARAFDPAYDGALDARGFIVNGAIAAFDSGSPSGRRRVVSERDLEHLEALYAGEVAWTDAQIGRVLAELERAGLADETLVVVVADHGDEFFEHGGIGHRRTLHEEVVRVPLILRLPGALVAGERRPEPIALADVPAHLAELLGEPALLPAEPAVPPVARLVLSERVTLEYQLGDTPMTAACLRARVLETFHHGSLVVARERSTLTHAGILEPAQRQALDERIAAATEEGEPRWIDLAREPGAPDAAWSADFTGPEARAALDAFRASYAALTARRAQPELLAEGDALRAALRGLGYGGTEPRVAPDDLVLPLPSAPSTQAR